MSAQDDHKPRVHSDEHGHSVLDDTIRTGKFELVSTQKLKAMISADERHRAAVAKLAEGQDEGVLAQDAATGHLHIIDDDELQSLLDASPGSAAPARPAEVTVDAAPEQLDEDLSLVSTQALRKLLDIPEAPGKKAAPEPVKDPGGGFDPYNTG